MIKIAKVSVFVVLLQPNFYSSAQSELDPATAYDCTTVQLEEVDPSQLTEAERVAMLEDSLFSSVDEYSTCMDQVQTEMVEQTASGNGGGAANTEINSNSEEDGEVMEAVVNEEEIVEDTERSEPRGSKNKLIKPKDNDSIVCRMLYEEIAKESDEKTKASLIEQYNSYNCG